MTAPSSSSEAAGRYSDILNLRDTARFVGRSEDRFRREWPDMVKEEGFPPPTREAGHPCWCRLHLVAWLDRRLPRELQGYVALLRGARPPRDGENVIDMSDQLRRQIEDLDKRYGGAA